MIKKVVRVTDLATMGKCENLAKLKLMRKELVSETVMHAARRGVDEHKKFEREPVSDGRCFVASWALGESHWATNELRVWRDEALLTHRAGRWFVLSYYVLSPWLIRGVSWIPWIKWLSSIVLISMVRKLRRGS